MRDGRITPAGAAGYDNPIPLRLSRLSVSHASEGAFKLA
jgi:hypothetical protein